MLLSAIEEKKFYPMGSDQPVSSNFQIVAGTNCDLRGESQGGNFREDLLARLNLWEFHLPSLRERQEDIEPNIDYELGRLGTELGMRIRLRGPARRKYLDFALSDEGLWLGNFRDLIASLTRMSTLASGGDITVEGVEREVDRLKRIWKGNGQSVRNGQAESLAEAGARAQLERFLGIERFEDLDELDQTLLAKVLQVCAGSESVAEASRRLMGKSRESLKKPNDTHRLKAYLARWNVDPADMVRFGKAS
jgi:transcriptional regulatory protein RtcR